MSKIDGIELVDYLKIFFERSVAVETFWNIYIAVSIGVITLTSTARAAFVRPSFLLVLILAFMIFSLYLYAIQQENDERRFFLLKISGL